MKTYIYMVRHGESTKTDGNERTRGLTEKGKADAATVAAILAKEEIDVYLSSPYERAVLTIKAAAESQGRGVFVLDELREMHISDHYHLMSDSEVRTFLQNIFADPDYALPGGESFAMCRRRSDSVIKHILHKYKGQKVVIGTHGIVMTLIMNCFESRYGLDFLLATSKPDIYKMEFDGDKWVEVTRLWK